LREFCLRRARYDLRFLLADDAAKINKLVVRIDTYCFAFSSFRPNSPMYASRFPEFWERLVHRPRRRCANLTPRRALRRRRAGAVVAEFAIVLPLLVTLSLVPIELSSMLFVKQSLRITAYETARVATKKLSTYSEARLHGEQILTERDITGWTIKITPPEAHLNEGDPITVTVTVPYADNSVVGFAFMNSILSEHIVMVKE
jgi:hypothetical protein